jgi:hypothetical protein
MTSIYAAVVQTIRPGVWPLILGLPIGETCRVSVPAPRPDDDERLVLDNLREAVAEVASGGGLATRDMRLASRMSQAASPNQTTQ